ncbi:hypothetical protein [Tepidibacter mesophilus]|nr:hypothetical protein [Tepidibacter mesophilus]
MTYHMVDMTVLGQNPISDAKGGRNFKVYRKLSKKRVKMLKES